jgi:competence protein ComEC
MHKTASIRGFKKNATGFIGLREWKIFLYGCALTFLFNLAVSMKYISSLRDAFWHDRMRWVLWMPVLMGIGIAVYFLLPTEPPFWPTALLGGVTLSAFLLLRQKLPERFVWRYVMLGIALASFGFGAAQFRTYSVHTPMIVKETGAVRIEGKVEYAETIAKGKRFVVVPSFIERLDQSQLPNKIRVTRNGKTDTTQIGDKVEFLAVLRPPPPPVLPGAYDFGRYAYFQQIGAVGFVVSPITVLEQGGEKLSSVLSWVETLREGIAQRICDRLEKTPAEIASALLVGKQQGIPQRSMDAIRASGLAHLLSISGLHLVMVTAMIFFTVRALLALLPSIAVRYSIKKWAAVAALVGAGFYLLLSGLPPPAQRAFFMSGIILCAILIDRVPLPMRSIALAAILILLWQPESMLGPSFQMSFAATAALIAIYEGKVGFDEKDYFIQQRPPIWKRIGRNIGGTALASIVAGLATAPYALYHFHRYPLYSVLANVVAVPLTTFIIMPLGMLALLLMPFGLEGFVLVPMGWGIQGVMIVAERTASWPWAVQSIPAISMPALGFMTFGMLWLVLWQARWRYIGVGIFAGGMLVAFLSYRVPDMLIRMEEGEPFIAVKSDDEDMVVVAGNAPGYVEQTWDEYYGLEAPKKGDIKPSSLFSCDARGCVYRVDAGSIAVTDDMSALREDCGEVSALIYTGFVRLPRSFACENTQIIQRYDLARGTHSLRLRGDGVDIESSADARGSRPWTQ